MRIVIETIPHSTQRYPTVGDYWRDADGTLQIRVSDLGNARAETLVAIHELVEQTLTEAAGISNEVIDRFDMGNTHLDDPGASEFAPYHHQHTLATAFEMTLCAWLGWSWEGYCRQVDAPR